MNPLLVTFSPLLPSEIGNENREILLSDAVGYVARQSFLDQAYFEKNVPIAYYRMSFAGSRLAYLIEELLGN